MRLTRLQQRYLSLNDIFETGGRSDSEIVTICNVQLLACTFKYRTEISCRYDGCRVDKYTRQRKPFARIMFRLIAYRSTKLHETSKARYCLPDLFSTRALVDRRLQNVMIIPSSPSMSTHRSRRSCKVRPLTMPPASIASMSNLYFSTKPGSDIVTTTTTLGQGVNDDTTVPPMATNESTLCTTSVEHSTESPPPNTVTPRPAHPVAAPDRLAYRRRYQ